MAGLFLPLLIALPLGALFLHRLRLSMLPAPNEEDDPYWWPESRRITSIFLRFTGGLKAEPTFVYVYVDNETRMGGLWGVVGSLRTIDWRNCSEVQVNATHWRTQSNTPWGLRQADYYVCRETASLVLLVETSYALNQTLDVLDWYWEQINYYGVDPDARVVVGLQNGTRCRMLWNVTSILNVMWLWMKYTEWLTKKERTVTFVLCQPCTVLLQQEHGNDVAPRIRVQTGAFRTLLRFDARCP